jgi:hypothetical protein
LVEEEVDGSTGTDPVDEVEASTAVEDEAETASEPVPVVLTTRVADPLALWLLETLVEAKPVPLPEALMDTVTEPLPEPDPEPEPEPLPEPDPEPETELETEAATTEMEFELEIEAGTREMEFETEVEMVLGVREREVEMEMEVVLVMFTAAEANSVWARRARTAKTTTAKILDILEVVV